MPRAGRKTVYIRESTGSRVIEQSRLRLACVGLFFALSYGAIAARMVDMMWHSVSNPPPERTASAEPGMDEENAQVPLVPDARPLTRGDIVDRNGVLLATSLMTASAFANPREIKDMKTAAQKLSAAVGISTDTLYKRIKAGKSFVWIKRHLTPKEQQAVNTLGIPGVYFLPEERRVYPYGAMTSHLLGYVGTDNHGFAGVEKQYDAILTDQQKNREPLKLALDIRVQHILRDEMLTAMQEFQAIGAVGVVMSVKTGEIVAMSSLPDFDPHRPAAASDDQKFNRVTLGTYEMGSTFKTFTLAMALDSGTTSLKGGYDATNPLKIGGFTISDSHPKKRWLSVSEIYAYSSNIGTARMALDVGIKKQREYLEALGLTKQVAVDLPEKGKPQVPHEWKEISAITVSYGHGMSVTPLHLVRAIATVAGDGMLRPLHVLKTDGETENGKRVISEKTANLVSRMMRLVVRHGTGGKADIEGYRVGGKTGTAEKIQGGTYSKNSNISSFISVFPVDAPEYVVLVMMDEPKGNKATYGYSTGGWTAAPAVGRIISRMAPQLGLPPVYDTSIDDAERYWVDTDPNPKKPVQTASKPTARAGTFRSYLHAASY